MTVNKVQIGNGGLSADDLVISRSARNTMIQDVLYFKKQLLRLRRILQEVSEDFD